ncbi:MAG: system potassium uptake protein, partial [Nocardioidaceae bacterium]|nr:system potassium uptake protein [Nocardioidaceae bacterium]
FWSITLIVTVLYVRLILRADNEGEGGLLSLVALLRRRDLSGRLLKVLATVGVFGAALFFGDSMITPAISVLSSTEGLEIVDPGLSQFVVPGAVAILVTLLVVQRWGTARVGKFFGPVMALWFAAIALWGAVAIWREPAILQALSPTWAVRYFASDPLVAFLSLGGVVLVLTGAEALYADLGHLGRKPIARSWIALVFPAVSLNYFGQGALLLKSPSSIGNPFFLLVPHWARLPMVILATLATVIASQAVISGAFSVARQATQLGYLPRLRVVHTSTQASESGQIYMPFVNWLLLIAVTILVLGFQSSQRLAAAYGLADIGTIMTSTILFFILQWVVRAWPRWRVMSLGLVFSLFVFMFLVANSVKIAEGGWLPVSIGIILFLVMTTWQRGRQLSDTSRNKAEGNLQDFVDELNSDKTFVQRVPGCAVFLSRGEGLAPLALRANVEHNHTLHECAILLTVNTDSVPRVDPDEQVSVDDLGFADDGISHVTALLGYLDHPSLPALLRRAVDEGLEGDPEQIEDASYFLSVSRLRVTDAPGMAKWRKHLYLTETKLTSDPIEFFDLPRKRTVSMGAEIDI